ncbi:tetratricopeptide repeat protein [Thermogemmatispora sp.]|uniref:tetratricopeptide repeat protein n=1 Tax=Thermogemmatispora sp. TaxID=1968838 RepID=UPI0035E42946
MATLRTLNAFCSCSASSDDRRRCQALVRHLTLLQQQGWLSLWHPGLLPPGSDAPRVRQRHSSQADLILLLLSPDYFADPLCQAELQEALARSQQRTARLVPILLRPCPWEHSPLGSLAPLPANARPLSRWHPQEEGLQAVADGLLHLLQDLAQLDLSQAPAPGGPPQLWNVPFPPSPFFIARHEELTRLQTLLQQQSLVTIGQTQVISGLGGVGKTRLAVEYAYRFRSCYRAVLWVLADRPESLYRSYRELAALLQLPQRDDPDDAQVLAAVRSWLQTQPGYLLILDNLDEPALLFPPSPEGQPPASSPFLPLPPAGHLLITTRAADLSSFGLGHALPLTPLPPEASLRLLLSRAGRLPPDAPLSELPPSELAAAQALCQELDGLPLALDQAGAYLAATGETVASYLALFRERQLQLLSLRSGHQPPAGGLDHPLPVATTWQLSLARAQERAPAAADLLRFCSLLAPAPIPSALLTTGLARLSHPLAAAMADPLTRNATIEALRAYSLLDRDARSGALLLHRLVQTVVRARLPAEEQLRWQELAIAALVEAYPGDAVEHWPVYESLLPHALQAAAWLVESEAAPLQTPLVATLLLQAGGYLHDHGRYPEALPLLERSLSICEQALGPHHPDTATSLNNLALLYHALGRLHDALPLYQRSLSIHEQALGPHHPDTASSLNDLASLYRDLGRFEDALPLAQRSLSICEQALGPDDPDTASSLYTLALLYRDLGRPDEALPLLERALAIYERALGPDHPITQATRQLHDTPASFLTLRRLLSHAWRKLLPLLRL